MSEFDDWTDREREVGVHEVVAEVERRNREKFGTPDMLKALESLNDPPSRDTEIERISERAQAVTIATWWLDQANADPDDDLRIVARQFLRCIDRSQPASEPTTWAAPTSAPSLDVAAKSLIRAADAYYEAIEDGNDRAYASHDAARHVLEVLEGYGIRVVSQPADNEAAE